MEQLYIKSQIVGPSHTGYVEETERVEYNRSGLSKPEIKCTLNS